MSEWWVDDVVAVSDSPDEEYDGHRHWTVSKYFLAAEFSNLWWQWWNKS